MENEAEHETRACDAAFGLAFEVLGKRWNGLLLATLITGSASFGDLRRAVDGISDSVLSDRLTELAKAGLVARQVTEGPPVGVRYELTENGRALIPALDKLRDWASSHLEAGAATPLQNR